MSTGWRKSFHGGPRLFHAHIEAEQFPHLTYMDLQGFLEVRGKDYVPAEGGVIRIFHLHVFDGEAHVSEITGQDGGSYRHRWIIAARNFDKKLVVADKDGSQVGGIDDGRIGKNPILVVQKQRMDRLVLKDGTVFLPFRVLGEDLAQGHDPRLLERYEGSLVRIGAPEVDWPGNYGRPIEADGNGLAFAAIVPGQLFLRLNEFLEHGIRYRNAPCHESGEIRPDGADAFIHFNGIFCMTRFPERNEEGIIGRFLRPVGPELSSQPRRRP